MKYFLFLFLFCAIGVGAQQLRVNTKTSFISYEASHPAHDWSGVSEKVQGVVVLENNLPTRIAIAASVASFNSKNSNRDAHALEVLDALSFPKVSFYTEDISLQEDFLSLKGELSFHGISAPLSTNASWKKDNDTWFLEGSFDVKPSDFDIKLPSFMLIKMRDKIHIRFRLELRTFAP